jgi:hypothetical protein
MCSKARSPEISFASVRISASERKGVVCARQTSDKGVAVKLKKRRNETDRALFIEVSCDFGGVFEFALKGNARAV